MLAFDVRPAISGLSSSNSVLITDLADLSVREIDLEQEFNSLAAQREACEAYIRSQQHEGWVLARNRYDDGGFSGGSIERPALQDLLADIRAGRLDIVVV